MALRLDDIKTPTTQQNAFFKTSWSSLDNFQADDSQTPTAATQLSENSRLLSDKLRPWQSFEDQDQTRTYAAREAIERAQRIREKNEQMCAQLRLGHVSQEVEERLKEIEDQREEEFNFEKVQMRMRESKIKTASSFVSFFRDLLKQ